jgi:hypothetical protein
MSDNQTSDLVILILQLLLGGFGALIWWEIRTLRAAVAKLWGKVVEQSGRTDGLTWRIAQLEDAEKARRNP